ASVSRGVRKNNVPVLFVFLSIFFVAARGEDIIKQHLFHQNFEFMYQGETTIVDLNLARGSNYSSPYPLGFNNIKREYFAIIHSGEGDGWNVNHPCMSSILMFQGKIYLIDAGPNVIHSLMTLGIGVNEIEGIFHTHAHDDHFAGFTTLMRSDHKLKYYSTPLVRASVAKKLSALMFIDEKDLSNYFEVKNLEFDEWNDIEGLKVKPIFSPHPVETSIFFFRTLWKDGHCTYAHLADIASKKVLEGMITDDESENGISKKYYDQVMASYLEPADIKKIDVGGGLIHGDAEDFEKDCSKKIILSHFSNALSQHQKEIGSGAPFGMVDVLIPTSQNYLYRTALKFLKEYFPNAPLWQLNILLNHDLVTFNPESILIRRGNLNKDIFLILTGNVELIQSELGVRNILSSGALLGEIAGLDEVPSTGTFRAMNFVHTLRLSRSLYVDFVKQNNLYESIRRLQSNREFLQNTWLFGEVVAYPIQNRLAQSMETIDCDKDHIFPRNLESAIYIVKSGILERYIGDRVFETLEPGYFFGEECVLFDTTSLFRVRAASPSKVYRIPGNVLLDIPVVRWKLFETFQKRMKLLLKPELTGKRPFDKQDEYNALMVEFEQQHQAISERANKLVSVSNENADISVIKDELNLLIRSIDFHIKQEEALMKRHNYSGYEIHHARHLSVLDEIRRIHMQTDYKEP
ncbi:cyclic nucleotide-binding domain-containing protein, partial [Desulfobacterales bacterium HSG16]|nr:cyclic nucleotide-binding domain-containing protein [Desulfobacterales bacterium HSG16]